MCTSSFISRARSSVWAATRSVPQADVLEQTAVHGLQSEQVITPIGGWAENGALSGARQYLGGFDQQCSRQCRTVRIEDNRRGMFARKYFLDRVQQAIAETRQARIDQADVRRQGVVEKRLGACRRESDVAGDRGMAPRRQQIASPCPEEKPY